MNPIDLVYLNSIGSVLERLAADKAAADASGAHERARELEQQIEELTARREYAAQRMFGILPVVGS